MRVSRFLILCMTVLLFGCVSNVKDDTAKDKTDLTDNVQTQLQAMAKQAIATAENDLLKPNENKYKAFIAANCAKHLDFLKTSAQQGYPIAQDLLGNCYNYGFSVTKDNTQAIFWYRKSAEQGYAFGQADLGSMYQDGSGIAQDYTQATFWYRQAAEQGEAIAQAALGNLYGKAQDYTQAAVWYRKAAEQGLAAAQFALGVFYEKGLGATPHDNAQALVWYSKAAKQGHKSAQKALQSIKHRTH